MAADCGLHPGGASGDAFRRGQGVVWYATHNLRPDMNLLMVTVLGVMAICEWFEAATVAFLFALSLALESWGIGRARRTIAKLLDLAPPAERSRREGANAIPTSMPVTIVRDLFGSARGRAFAAVTLTTGSVHHDVTCKNSRYWRRSWLGRPLCD